MSAPVIPQPSRSSPDAPGIPIPRHLGWGVAITLFSACLGAAAWAKTLDTRVAELERAQDKAEIVAADASKALQRIEKTLCAVCMANLGQGACRASCGL